ncbi:MAG: outer membrane beta-barrel protein [Candidatus Marinimicrobia bacterium]|jgi:opacity protein-like surface antigen|nr:outer membrane beta-barrel protein [Candidatus Neomarinimicrobiota bacterium]
MKNYLKFLLVLSLVFSFSFLFAQEETSGDEEFQQLLEEEDVGTEAVEEEDSFLDKVTDIAEEEEEEAIVEEVADVDTWGVKAYVNVGAVEPWGDPGTGALFDMGFHFGGGVIVKLSNFVDLPAVLDPLNVEGVVSYTSFAQKDDGDGTATVIGVGITPRYDVSDLVFDALGVEPVVGVFGLLGLRYNYHSWDSFPILEDESASSFGLDIGAGVKYNINESVGLDLRFTQGLYGMTAIDTYDDYSHSENGFLLGVTFKIQ